MPERQRGEAPEAAASGEPEARIVMWWCHEHGAQMQMVDGEHRPDCAEGCGPMLAVPYVREVAVADAVRAERERVARALDAANFKPRRLRVDDGAGPPYDVRYQAPAEFVRALPPADGNTEEEG